MYSAVQCLTEFNMELAFGKFLKILKQEMKKLVCVIEYVNFILTLEFKN